MRKKNILVLDGNPERGLTLRNYLRQKGYDSQHMTGLHDIQRARDYDGLVAFQNLDAFGVRQNGDELCAAVTNAKIAIPKFYMGSTLPEVSNVATKEINKQENPANPSDAKIFRAVLDSRKPNYEESLVNALEESVHVPVRIGFISAGRLTTGIIRTLYSKYAQYFSQLGVVSISQTPRHNNEGIRVACEMGREDSRLRVYESSKKPIENLKEMLKENYDIILHTSSKSKGVKIKEGRNYLWEIDRDIVKNVSANVALAERELAEEGNAVYPLHIMATNPIGANMMLAVTQKMSSDRLTGFSYVDKTRAQQWICDWYYRMTGEQLDKKTVEAQVIGQHGEEILIQNTVRINGKSLEELGMKIDAEEAAKGIRAISREGAETREGFRKDDKYDLLYMQPSEAFSELCVDIARRRQLSAPLYAIRDLKEFLETDGFVALSGPVSIDYYGISGNGMRISGIEMLKTLPITDKEKRIFLEDLAREAEFQKTSVQAYLNQTNGWLSNLLKKLK